MAQQHDASRVAVVAVAVCRRLEIMRVVVVSPLGMSRPARRLETGRHAHGVANGVIASRHRRRLLGNDKTGCDSFIVPVGSSRPLHWAIVRHVGE